MVTRHLIATLIGLAILLTGCAPGLVDARTAVNRVAELYATTEPALERQRRAAGDACFESSPPGDPHVTACLDAVRTRWRPVEAAVIAVYAALVGAQSTVGAAEAAAAIGRAPSVALVLAAVGRALDAAARLGEAVDVMRQETAGPVKP